MVSDTILISVPDYSASARAGLRESEYESGKPFSACRHQTRKLNASGSKKLPIVPPEVSVTRSRIGTRDFPSLAVVSTCH